jgi:cytochrome c oxidase assembly protein Cox11
VPGETALAFHRTKNLTDKPVIGISTSFIYFVFSFFFQKIKPDNKINKQININIKNKLFFILPNTIIKAPNIANTGVTIPINLLFISLVIPSFNTFT